jgi:FkbM family methyltransferase
MLSLFRFLPPSVRLKVFYRFFAGSPETRSQLYADAPLALAPAIRMKLVPGDWAHRPIAYTGIYEWPVTQRIAELARSGGDLIDVGANAGYFSLLWAALNSGNRVDAFEALPANVDRLRQNIDRNKLGDRIHLHPFALGASDGAIAFETGHAEQSGWGGIAAGKSATTIEVEVRRLDGVIPKTARATTVKIDCEGADSWVIEGAQGLLSQPQVREVFFEVNEPRQAVLGISSHASQDLLKSLGFQCEQIDVHDWHARKA